MVKLSATAIAVLCLIAVVIGAVIASVVVQYYYPNQGTIGDAQVYINKTEYLDQDEVNWGICQPGWEHSKNLTVVNIGNTALNFSVVAKDLPVGWTLTWTRNQTIAEPTDTLMGWLNLTIPLSATEWGEWGWYLIGEQP